MFYSVSSPYLLVFTDDRVHSTREQMMLQVDLVRLAGAGLDWDSYFYSEFLLCFGTVVIIYIIRLEFYYGFLMLSYNKDFENIYDYYKVLNFSRFGK